MHKNKVFAVSIYGRNRLLGIVVADGMNAFPKSTWYDYSAQMKAAVDAESQIAKSGYMTRAGIRSARLAKANQKTPRNTDVVLRFSNVREIDKVQITAGRRSQTIVLSERTSTLADPFLDTSKQIIKAIGRML